ncbi:hypothetical protein AgCh_035730 [Apium graveolens]
MATHCIGKSSWPELVGEEGEVAAAKVEQENPEVNAVLMLEGSAATQDYRCDRVRVVVNTHGIVVYAPHIG